MKANQENRENQQQASGESSSSFQAETERTQEKLKNEPESDNPILSVLANDGQDEVIRSNQTPEEPSRKLEWSKSLVETNDSRQPCKTDTKLEAALDEEAIPGIVLEPARPASEPANQRGQGIEPRRKFLKTIFRANQESARACLEVGEMFRAGIGTQKNIHKAVDYWYRSLPPGYQLGWVQHGPRYFATLDHGDSLSLNRESPDSYRTILLSIASYYRQQEPILNSSPLLPKCIQWGYAAAVSCLEILVQHGDIEATHLLGLMCLEGKGLPIDLERGLRLLNRALRAEHPDAFVILGFGYLFGNFGIPLDPPRGRQLLRSAIEKRIEFPDWESMDLDEPKAEIKHAPEAGKEKQQP